MISLPNKPKVIDKDKNQVKIEIKPLYPGYGVTIGNTYRRILLSSLEGAAVTEVKIKGVNHEFSTISGVLEDVVMILLNLKKVRFSNWADEPQTITLSSKGEGKVKAKDFKLTPHLKLANPDQHIATITEKGTELNIEAKIEKGVGYMLAEEREDKKSDVESLNIDAIFSPVKRVSFQTENVRVGKRTDFEKLVINIETDGVTDPEEAFEEGTSILMEHFKLFDQFGEEEEEEKEEKEKEKRKQNKKEKKSEKEIRKIKIKDIEELPERTKNALMDASIKSIGGLIRKTESDISEVEGIGRKGIKEIKDMLSDKGMELKEE